MTTKLYAYALFNRFTTNDIQNALHCHYQSKWCKHISLVPLAHTFHGASVHPLKVTVRRNFLQVPQQLLFSLRSLTSLYFFSFLPGGTAWHYAAYWNSTRLRRIVLTTITVKPHISLTIDFTCLSLNLADKLQILELFLQCEKKE